MTNKGEKKTFDIITNEKAFTALKMILAILIALVITFVILCMISKNPLNALVIILTGPLTKARYFGLVISKTIPYAFSGLAAAVLFKSGAFNLGSEGIFIISGVPIAAVACSSFFASTGALHPYICVLVGAIVGAVLMIIPSFLAAKYGTNEMVASLMLNTMYSGIALYFVRTYMLSLTASNIGTKDYLESAIFGYIYEPLKITPCLILLIIVTIVMHYIMNKTRLGYEIRLIGSNPKFAEYSGINSFALAVKVAAISGALSGIGSACQLLTQTEYYQPSNTCVGIGFAGMLLAMLGKNNPIPTVIAAFMIQYLERGTNVLYFTDTSVPSEIVAIVEGVIILMISSQYFLRGLREKKLLQEGLSKDAK